MSDLVNSIATSCKANYTFDWDIEEADEITILLSEVCGKLARVHEIAPKANVEFLLQLVGAYEIILTQGKDKPDKTPYQIIKEDILPYLDSVEESVEHNEEGFEVGELTKETI